MTLNHLDTVRRLVGENAEHHIGLVDNAIKILTDVSIPRLFVCLFVSVCLFD